VQPLSDDTCKILIAYQTEQRASVKLDNAERTGFAGDRERYLSWIFFRRINGNPVPQEIERVNTGRCRQLSTNWLV